MIIYMVVGKVNHQHLKLEGTAADTADKFVVQAVEAVAILPRAFPYYQQKSQSDIALPCYCPRNYVF